MGLNRKLSTTSPLLLDFFLTSKRNKIEIWPPPHSKLNLDQFPLDLCQNLNTLGSSNIKIIFYGSRQGDFKHNFSSCLSVLARHVVQGKGLVSQHSIINVKGLDLNAKIKTINPWTLMCSRSCSIMNDFFENFPETILYQKSNKIYDYYDYKQRHFV